MTVLFTRIPEAQLEEYHYLSAKDACLHLREYTAHAGFQGSDTNQLIFNLKKGLERRDTREWHYKTRDVRRCGQEIGEALALVPNAHRFTYVPVPPSAGKDDPMHDDRLVQILSIAKTYVPGLDVRELVVQATSRGAMHKSGARRPRPDQHADGWSIDETLTDPSPRYFAVFDDVLTTGSSFKGMEIVLRRRFPELKGIIGVFIARTIRP